MLKKITILILMVLMMALPVAHAQDVEFFSTVNANQVALGSSIQLTLTVSGDKDAQVPELPDIDGFESQYIGPSTRVSVVNGEYTSSKSFIYMLFPMQEGKFQIPAFKMDIKGKFYESDSINIEVLAQGTSAASQISSAKDEPESLKNKMFLVMGTSKDEVYVNEKVPLTIKFLWTQLTVREIEYPKFENIGFIIDKFSEQPRQYKQSIKGISYNVLEFNTHLYPTREGVVSLGPATISFNILLKSNKRRNSLFTDMGGFFDEDMFSGFFESYHRHPMTINSSTVDLNVLSLPEQGKPSGFTGAVGKYNFDMSASPEEVQVGDPVTINMSVFGQGNLDAVKMPAIKDERFKIYEPQIKEENKSKFLEQVIIPTSDDIVEVPAISFSYFNIEDKKYETITKGPFPIKVIKPKHGQGFQVVGFEGGSQVPIHENFGRDLIFIKDHPGKLVKVNSNAVKSPIFIFTLLFVVASWLGFCGFYWQSHKLKTDKVYARRLFAPRKARKGMEKVRHLLQSDNKQEFYDFLFQVFVKYLADKFHVPSGNVSASVMKKILKAKGCEGKIIAMVNGVFEDCEMVRYASAQIDQDKMNQSLKQIEEIIDYCERQVR